MRGGRNWRLDCIYFIVTQAVFFLLLQQSLQEL